MSDRLRIKEWRPIDNFGKRIRGVLECMACQRADRLDFSSRCQPAPDRRSCVTAPVFDEQRQMRRPQKTQLGNPYDDVVARLDAVDQPLEIRETLGRRLAVGQQRLLQAYEVGGSKVLFFQ